MDPTLPPPSIQKILVVDDAPDIHALIRARLHDENVEIHSASDGTQGLAMAKELLPDLVLLDLDMPDISGLDVIRDLKRTHATFNIPVIFLTGENSTDAKVKGFDLGAVDYVTKPFDSAELRARVRASLRTKFMLDLLSQRAMLDGLTGLWNHAFFKERLAAEGSLVRRTGNALSLIMIDVDHFKTYNDTYGHPFGDELLRALSHRLLRRARVSDVVCRYGGEEFAIILPNTNALNASILAENLRRIISEMVLHKGKNKVSITVSLGVTDLADDFDTDNMIRTADDCLYKAKHAGRNRAIVEHSASPAGIQRLDLKNTVTTQTANVI